MRVMPLASILPLMGSGLVIPDLLIGGVQMVGDPGNMPRGVAVLAHSRADNRLYSISIVQRENGIELAIDGKPAEAPNAG